MHVHARTHMRAPPPLPYKELIMNLLEWSECCIYCSLFNEIHLHLYLTKEKGRLQFYTAKQLYITSYSVCHSLALRPHLQRPTRARPHTHTHRESPKIGF